MKKHHSWIYLPRRKILILSVSAKCCVYLSCFSDNIRTFLWLSFGHRSNLLSWVLTYDNFHHLVLSKMTHMIVTRTIRVSDFFILTLWLLVGDWMWTIILVLLSERFFGGIHGLFKDRNKLILLSSGDGLTKSRKFNSWTRSKQTLRLTGK